MDMERRVKRLEDLVDLLRANSTNNDARIGMLVKYMLLLKEGYGFTQENQELFKKLLLEEYKLKKFIEEGEPLYTEKDKFCSMPFNLEPDDNLYDTASLYNLPLSNYDLIFEVLVSGDNVTIFSDSHSQTILTYTAGRLVGSAIFTLNGEILKPIMIYTDTLFPDALDSRVKYSSTPIILKYDSVTANLLILTASITTKKKLELKWRVLGAMSISKGLILHRKGIGYLAKKGTIPDAIGVLFEGEYRKRLRVKEELLLEQAQNFGFNNYIGLAGLQGSSYIKDLYAHAIESRVYNFNLSSSYNIELLGALSSSRMYDEGLVSAKEGFTDIIVNILCGMHDPNDRIPDPDRHQTVIVRSTAMNDRIHINFKKEKYKPNIDKINLSGDDHYDLPISIDRKELLSGDQVSIPGFLRITQTINKITFDGIHNIQKGEITNARFLAVGQLQYKGKESLNPKTWEMRYEGKGYVCGMGEVKEYNIDGYVITAIAGATLKFQLFIDASHALSIDPVGGEYVIQINDKSYTITSTFLMTKIMEGSITKTYLASQDKFSIDIERKVGVQDSTQDQANSDYLGITKVNDNGKIVNPTDNARDSYIITAENKDGWEYTFGNEMFKNPEHMQEKLPNVRLTYSVDDGIFDNRVSTQNHLFDNKYDASVFGWNGMMKPGVNTWSRYGYIEEFDLKAMIQINTDLWKRDVCHILPYSRTPLSNFDNTQIRTEIGSIMEFDISLPTTFNYQPPMDIKLKVSDVTISNVTMVDASEVNNLFDSNNDLLSVKYNIELIFKTQRDLYSRLSQIEYKVDKAIEVIKKILDELDKIIDAIRNMKGSGGGSSIIQDLFNAGMFVLEMFAPSLVLFFAPFALLLAGIVSLTTGDISAGIVDLVAGAVIFGYYHVPLYVVPYSKRLINKFTNFSDIKNSFTRWTSRIGNGTRDYVPSFWGAYNVRQSELLNRRSQYTYTRDQYTQRFELVELDLWPPRLSFRRKNSKLRHLYDADKEVKYMVIKMFRIFVVKSPDNKLNTIRGTVTFKFGSQNVTTKRSLGGRLNELGNNDVNTEFTLEYRSLINKDGLFTYTTITDQNFKSFFDTEMDYNELYYLIYSAILLDYPQSVANYTSQLHDFLDGLVERAVVEGKIDHHYRAVGLYAPHVGMDAMAFTNNVIMSCLGYYGKDYKFPELS